MRLGRTFISPALDVLLIGGALSLPVALAAHVAGYRFDVVHLWQIVLLATYAHVAASLLRLYSSPGVARRRPVLSVGFPFAMALATGAVVLASAQTADRLGGMYIMLSSYHYAAQAYGLALMYVYRSGGSLSPREKRFIHLACLATFFYSVLGPSSGLASIVPVSVYTTWPAVEVVRRGLRALLLLALVGAPLSLAAYRQRRGQPLPMMSLVIIYTNALWWVLFVATEAFAWAALSHGVQYLAIAMVFHVKDAREKQPGRHGAFYFALTFYVACVALAYGLYYGLPALYAMTWWRFDHSATSLRIALMLNVHHIVIDGFIWRRGAQATGARVPAAVPAGRAGALSLAPT
jgi:hypothetical protein